MDSGTDVGGCVSPLEKGRLGRIAFVVRQPIDGEEIVVTQKCRIGKEIFNVITFRFKFNHVH